MKWKFYRKKSFIELNQDLTLGETIYEGRGIIIVLVISNSSKHLKKPSIMP